MLPKEGTSLKLKILLIEASSEIFKILGMEISEKVDEESTFILNCQGVGLLDPRRFFCKLISPASNLLKKKINILTINIM